MLRTKRIISWYCSYAPPHRQGTSNEMYDNCIFDLETACVSYLQGNNSLANLVSSPVDNTSWHYKTESVNNDAFLSIIFIDG